MELATSSLGEPFDPPFMERFFLFAIDGNRPERELPRSYDYRCGEVRVLIVIPTIGSRGSGACRARFDCSKFGGCES